MQDEISAKIAGALQVSLGISDNSGTTATTTTSPEVYDLYLRARALHRKRGHGLLVALELFERALAIDPEFAPAWAGLSHTLNVIIVYVSPEEMEAIGDADARSMQAAQKALELDPTLSMALHALANNYLAQLKWSEAQEYYKKALLQDPDSPDIMEDFGHFFLYSWQLEKAKFIADRMILLDPLVPIFRFMATRVYAVLGETEIQDEHIAVALGINPDLGNVQTQFLQRLLEKKEYLAAHSYIDQMEFYGWTTAEAMHQMIDWVIDPTENPEGELLTALRFVPEAALTAGQYDLWIETAWNGQVGWEDFIGNLSLLSSFSNEDRFQQLHANPKAKELIKKSGLPEYWQKVGWPPRCRPIGADDFVCE